MRSPRPSRICRRREGGWRAARVYRQGERVRAQAQARAIQSARSRHALAARTHGPAQLTRSCELVHPLRLLCTRATHSVVARDLLLRDAHEFAWPTSGCSLGCVENLDIEQEGLVH